MHAGDRLHMIGHEAVAGNEIPQTVLNPSYRSRVIILIVLMIGVAVTEAHRPTAARVVLEYVSWIIDLRQPPMGCRLFPGTSRAISRHAAEYLKGSS